MTKMKFALYRVFPVLLITFILLIQCKKDSVVGRKITNKILSGIDSRLRNIYSEVSYNSTYNMLEFDDLTAFKETEIKLQDEISNFEFDNGLTNELMAAISSGLNEQDLTDSLINNSPLSDTVLVSIMQSGALSQSGFVDIMLHNLDLSEKTLEAYTAMTLDQANRSIVDDAIKHRTQFYPGLSEFENQFSGFISYRKKISEEEVEYLSLGYDPENSENPQNQSKLGAIEGSLYNSDLEVKIGDLVVKMLPGKNIGIKDGDLDVLNYIRQYGDVPRYTPGTVEPSNGFLKADAPLVIDTSNIIIQPTEHINNGPCVEDITLEPIGNNYNWRTQSFDSSAAIRFSTNLDSTAYAFYWDFGDGKISYKSSPVHAFEGTSTFNTVTVTVFDSYGNHCSYRKSAGSSGSSGGSQSEPCDVSGTGLVVNKGPGIVTFATVGWNFNLGGYLPGHNVYYTVDFGDGSPTASGTAFNSNHLLQHSYSQGTTNTYTVTLWLQWTNSQTNTTCNITRKATISYASSQSEDCCDKRDKEKDKWESPDEDIKFKHKLKIKNNFATGGKIEGTINTYHKLGPGWIGINASACVNLSGEFYEPCDDSKCDGTAYEVNPLVAYFCGKWFNHDIVIKSQQNCRWYVKVNGMSSGASCWGAATVLSITDGCD